MPKPNYSFEKRQRELAKKKKQEEKRQRKAATHKAGAEGSEAGGPTESATDAQPKGGGADSAR